MRLALAPAPMHWTRRYVGLQWVDLGRSRDGVDCWGVPYLAFPAELGIPVRSYIEAAGPQAADAALAEAADSVEWNPVAPGRAREWDVALFRVGGLYAHVGIYLGDGTMLHASRRAGQVRIDGLIEAPWRSQLVGFYRHREIERRQSAIGSRQSGGRV